MSTPSTLTRFSLYRRAGALALSLGIDPRKLGSVPRDEAPSARLDEFEGRVRTMHAWCRRNERLILDKNLPEVRIYAGFQRFSRLRPVLHRYRRLAAQADTLRVFGVEDVAADLPSRCVVPLAPGALAREWFLLVESPSYKTLLVARDLDGFESDTPPSERRFVGYATHHPELVTAVGSALRQRLEHPSQRPAAHA